LRKTKIYEVESIDFSSPALVAPSERRRSLLGIRIPYLSPPVDDREKKN